VQEWAGGDDGRPVLLLNRMRYREALGSLPPGSDFSGSPQEANASRGHRVAGRRQARRGTAPGAYRLGRRYHGARSNELGFANYEVVRVEP
jgi:hypothetical protein